MDTNIPTNTQAPFEPLEWSALAHPEHERSPRWYLYAGLFVLACAVYGIFSGAWSFAVVVVLAGGMYFLLRNAPPVIKTISIQEKGFTLNGKFTDWKDCVDFWIVTTPDYSELHIKKNKGTLDREVILQTADIPLSTIRSSLSQKIPERSDQGEKTLDMFIRLLKL